MTHTKWTRRRFAAATAAAFGALCGARPAAGEKPLGSRATDGDERYDVDWDQKLQITVGLERGDLVGRSDRVVQAAVDYLARHGGGTVKLLPGEFTFRNAVQLGPGIRLQGSGPETILTKIASQTVELADDSDWYDQEITLAKPADFRVGDGIVLRARNPHTNGDTVIKRTLVARSGNRFKLNDGLRENLWLSGKPRCSSLFPLLTSERTADVVIEHLTLDGNRENNENLDGNHAGCIFLQDCSRYTIRDVEARNYNGDGVSFQICHDIHVERLHSHDHAGLGLHPGSGSQRPVIRGCQLDRNDIGLFWCWGVKFGLAEHNRLDGNRRFGISIGHNDTDNLMRHNQVANSGQVGILFRDDARGKDFWPNRNRVEQNRVVDSGDEQGVAIDVQGKTRDIVLASNEIQETRGPAQRTAIQIGPDAGRVALTENRITGFATDVRDLRPAERRG